MKTRIKKCAGAILAVVCTCIVYAQSSVRDLANIANAYVDGSRESRERAAAPDHIKDIFTLAKTSAEEDFNIDFCGFFTGMSRYDAQDLVAYYKLKDGEYLISAAPGKAVSKLWFSLKGVRRITRGGSTMDELVQAVANRVGDLKHDWSSGMYEHRTIDGVVVMIGRGGLSIENVGVALKKPVTTMVNAQKDEKDEKGAEALLASMPVPVASIIQNMVAIPGMNYKMGRTEVTQAQWEAVMGNNPSQFKNSNNPVENVSWNDCQEFISKLNALPEVKAFGWRYRLPTEEEWVYACRAGSTGDYCKLADGTEITESTLGKVAWYNHNSDEKTHPVGQKKPNAFGLYDMHGNVREWCQDLYKGCERRELGGSWLNVAGDAAVSFRFGCGPDFRSAVLGFRLAASQKDRADVVAAQQAAAEEAARRERAAAEEAARRERALKKAVSNIINNMVAIPGKNFKMGKYEVTQEQWEAVMGENPSDIKGPNNPVENVSWEDCKKFLEKLNSMPEVKKSGLTFRLPTEIEWEYACRAGSMGDYCKLADGKEITESTLDEVAWYKGNSDSKTHPVGQKKPNAFGLYDMHGNVWEWCEDLCGAGNSRRVFRGGSWLYSSRFCMAGHRGRLSPDFRGRSFGFRLAASQD